MGKGKKGGLIFGMKNNSICNLLKRTRDVKLIIYLGGIYSGEGLYKIVLLSGLKLYVF